MNWLRIIGDVHGKYDRYISIAKKAEHSIQLGDMGFRYNSLYQLDTNRHKVLGGNHDEYTERDGKFINQTEHFLGDFGVHSVPNFGDFFFVRGGHSIDKKWRREGLDWWPGEQLSYSQGQKALEMYLELKPDNVITHECPTSIIDYVSGIGVFDGEVIMPSMTANLLQAMFEAHQPKIWFFGHHHRDFSQVEKGTHFRCLNELSYFDFDKNEGK